MLEPRGAPWSDTRVPSVAAMADGQVLLHESAEWRDLHGFVYKSLRAHGLSHADAEDLAQDIVEAAFVRLDTIAPERRQAWVAGVIRNKLADRARHKPPCHSLTDLPEAADPALGPDELALASADRRIVFEALAALPERDRKLLTLRYLEECSLRSVAEAVGMSTGAAKVALHRARERLRVMLEAAEAAMELESRRGVAMAGIAERAVAVLAPYVGRVAADTCVRGTAVSIGKTFDTLTGTDIDALAHRVRLVLAPLLSPDTIERLLSEIRGGVL